MKNEYSNQILEYLKKQGINFSTKEKRYLIKTLFAYENNNKNLVDTKFNSISVEEDINFLLEFCNRFLKTPLINERIKKLNILKIILEYFDTVETLNFVSQELNKIRLDLDLNVKVYRKLRSK